jgi:hypothetical protein
LEIEFPDIQAGFSAFISRKNQSRLLDIEDKNTAIHRNFGDYLPKDPALHFVISALLTSDLATF